MELIEIYDKCFINSKHIIRVYKLDPSYYVETTTATYHITEESFNNIIKFYAKSKRI